MEKYFKTLGKDLKNKFLEAGFPEDRANLFVSNLAALLDLHSGKGENTPVNLMSQPVYSLDVRALIGPN